MSALAWIIVVAFVFVGLVFAIISASAMWFTSKLLRDMPCSLDYRPDQRPPAP